MQISFMNRSVSEKEVINALSEFDHRFPETNDFDQWLDKANYKYAIKFEDRLYPPKYILNMITHVNLSEFNGAIGRTVFFNRLDLT